MKMLRSTSLIPPLTATDRFAVIDGYNNLCGILAPYNVELVHFEGIQLGFKELGLCIPYIGMETYLEMGVALFEVLETYHPHEAIVLTLIGQSNGGLNHSWLALPSQSLLQFR